MESLRFKTLRVESALELPYMYYTNGVDFSLELVTREDELITFVSNSWGILRAES